MPKRPRPLLAYAVLAAASTLTLVTVARAEPLPGHVPGGRVLAAQEAPVRVAWQLPDEPVRANAPFDLAVRIELERAFLDGAMVQPFRRELDVPVRLAAAALEQLEGVRFLSALGSEEGPTLAVDDMVVRASTATSSGPTLVVVVGRRALAAAPGTIDLPAPRVSYAHATRFRDDVFAGRVPEDRRDDEVVGEAARLVVAGHPEEGRPSAFVDAVGSFTLRAYVDDATLEPGQELTLTVAVEGTGNLATLTPPRLDTLAGWHLQGAGVRRDDEAVVVVATLSPRTARVGAVPPIEFAWYEPADDGGAYALARTEPIPVRVGGAAPARRDAPRDPAVTEPAASDDGGLVLPLVVGAGLALVVVLGALVARRGRPAGAAPAAPRAARRDLHAARRRFEAAAGDDPDATHAALRAFLAAVLGCSEAAVDSHDLPERLAEAGVAAELARASADELAAHDARRFGAGGSDDPGAAARARALVEALAREA